MNKLNNILIITLFSIVIFVSSCKEIPVEIPKFQLPEGNKVVLIEDLTGVRCPNCPTGTAKLKSLETLYEGRIAIVGIHGDFLTFPLEENKQDFRNEYSIALENALKPFGGKPSVGIDRTVFKSGSFAVSGIESWQGYIESQLEKEVLIDINLAIDFNPDSRTIQIDCSAIPQQDNLEGKYKISVILTESEIVDAQKGPTGLIEEYEHQDVLRTMLTSALGDEISINTSAFVPTKRSFNFALTEDIWIEKNMDVIVFITNVDTKEVIQTRKAKFIE